MKCYCFCNIVCIVPLLGWWGGSSLKIFCFLPVLLKSVFYGIATLNRILVNIGTTAGDLDCVAAVERLSALY